MWFKYPAGYSAINVEQMDFGVDYKDRDGNQYFRAPESLAPKILVVPGFVVVTRPEDAPADLVDETSQAKVDPLAQLSSQVETLRLENETLRQGAVDWSTAYNELKAENESLKRQVETLSPPGEMAKEPEPEPQGAEIVPQEPVTEPQIAEPVIYGEGTQTEGAEAQNPEAEAKV